MARAYEIITQRGEEISGRYVLSLPPAIRSFIKEKRLGNPCVVLESVASCNRHGKAWVLKPILSTGEVESKTLPAWFRSKASDRMKSEGFVEEAPLSINDECRVNRRLEDCRDCLRYGDCIEAAIDPSRVTQPKADGGYGLRVGETLGSAVERLGEYEDLAPSVKEAEEVLLKHALDGKPLLVRIGSHDKAVTVGCKDIAEYLVPYRTTGLKPGTYERVISDLCVTFALNPCDLVRDDEGFYEFMKDKCLRRRKKK